MLKIPDRFGRKDPLKPDEIDAIIERFEQAAAEDELPGGAFGGKRCQICWHLSRKEIHRDLLQGITYARLEEEFKVGMTVFHRHYYRHLIPYMRREIGKFMLDVATRIEATRKFPKKSNQIKQYEWCLEQLDAIRRIQVDEIDTVGKTKVKTTVLNDWFKSIIEIRSTLALMYGKPKTPLAPGEGEESKTVTDFLTPEQREVMAKAKKMKEEGADEKSPEEEDPADPREDSGTIPEP